MEGVQFKLYVSQIILKKNHKTLFKYPCSSIDCILKIDENFKCLLGIIQTSTYSLVTK